MWGAPPFVFWCVAAVSDKSPLSIASQLKENVGYVVELVWHPSLGVKKREIGVLRRGALYYHLHGRGIKGYWSIDPATVESVTPLKVSKKKVKRTEVPKEGTERLVIMIQCPPPKR